MKKEYIEVTVYTTHNTHHIGFDNKPDVKKFMEKMKEQGDITYRESAYYEGEKIDSSEFQSPITDIISSDGFRV